jgi:hypothetical protein
MSADEEKPLLTKDVVEDSEEAAPPSALSGSFAKALQLGVRASIMMCLLGAIVWIPAVRKPFPNQIQARIPLVICLYVFTINPLLGTAVQNAFCGIIGTFWACFHMWVMNGIFPGGMKEGMSPTSACAIFGWANFLGFTLIILWCKCGLGTKMFALATDIGFMLAFLDPASTVPFSENFAISHRGTAVNVMLATIIGCAAAPLMNLLPYPMDSAYSDMKGAAVSASKNTATLFEAIIVYYAGREGSVVVESQVKHAADLRAEIDAMGGSIGAAYWEGLDIGTRGTVRALMESHLGLMNNIYDRLRAILVVVQTEDFGDSHVKVMDKIHDASVRVGLATKKLLIAVTAAASDGDISEEEKTHLASLVTEAKAAVKQLAKDFDGVRKTLKTPVSTDLLGENYFVLTISAYARLVIDYGEMMMNSPPQGAGFGAAVVGGIKGTFDLAAMTEKFNLNFTIVHYLALIVCWLYSVYVDKWAGGCVITAVFLMSPNVCPDIQAFLNVLNAVILAVVAGTLVFQWSCGSGFGDYVLPFAAFVLWAIGMYGVFSKSVFLLPCLIFVALTPFRWVTSCPTGDIAAGARALWGGMVANILAIIFVCGFQFFLAVDRANNLATGKLDDAFGGLRKSFDAFWQQQDATGPMGSVSGDVGAGKGFCVSASIEPRMWRNNWKAGLYVDIAAHVETIRLDILMLWFAMAGSDGVPDAIFAKFDSSTTFKGVQGDLNSTLEDAHSLAVAMLSHETGTFTGLNKLKTTTGIDTLGDLPSLISHLNSTLKFSTTVPESMEDDEICQVSTVCMLLDSTIKHIAALIKGTIKQA